MSDRVTLANVRQAEERLNRSLEALGAEYQVRVEGRYGYLGIDRYRGEDCLSTITTGLSPRDAYAYLGAMNSALALLPQN